MYMNEIPSSLPWRETREHSWRIAPDNPFRDVRNMGMGDATHDLFIETEESPSQQNCMDNGHHFRPPEFRRPSPNSGFLIGLGVYIYIYLSLS